MSYYELLEHMVLNRVMVGQGELIEVNLIRSPDQLLLFQLTNSMIIFEQINGYKNKNLLSEDISRPMSSYIV